MTRSSDLRPIFHKAPLAALLLGTSTLALSAPAWGQEVVFADNPDLAAAALRGERVTQGSGVTQLRLASGAVLSFVEGAQFQLRPDGSVDLLAGNLTVTGAGKAETVVHMGGTAGDGAVGRIGGAGSSGSFSVSTDARGKINANGRVLTGVASIGNERRTNRFAAGQAWEIANGHPRLATATPPAATPRMTPEKAAEARERKELQAASVPEPAPQVASVNEGGPAAAAENGVPVVLGEALAAAGASGDIVSAGRRIQAAAANPVLETFPSGDLAQLVAYAAQLERLYGGQPFSQAQADIIRTYLGYLASGGTQAQFLTVYAGLMVQFLDLVRSGAAPSSFSGTTLADVNAFLSYRSRTTGFATLSSQNQALVDAYLAFLRTGGNADQFLASYTSLTSAYFAFLRGGGDPVAFQGASQATINAYIAFLNDAGLLAQLADADRALLNAYLANGGAGFIGQYRTALTAYFTHLSAGGKPSDYTAIDPAVLRQYLETLQASGLFEQVLGAQAQFYASYLAYLRTGGTLDGFAGLPVNVFTGYAQALSAYQAYLAAGGVPSAYTALDPAVLRQYLDTLAQAGAFDRFLGGNAGFYAQYLAYLQGGGTIDGWQGLPVNIFTGYAQALQAYYDYLANGGVPSAYTALSQDQINAYLAALQAAGANGAFLGQLASFYSGYFAFLTGGGNPDLFAGLPTPPDFAALADAVSAYVAYLQGGGVPSAYTGADLALLQQYIKALIDSGQLATLLGGQADFLNRYYAFLTGGGSADGFTGLPVYASYVSALEAYYAYLAGGGVPSAYTALTQDQILAYLRALTDAGVLAQLFSGDTLAFVQSFYTYLASGGSPDLFSGLPGSGSGGTGGGTITRLTSYTGGFVSGATGAKTIGGHNGNIQPANFTPTLGSNGGLLGSGDIGPDTATATDIAGDASAVVGRLANGTARFKNSVFNFGANNGLPYVVLAPKGGTLPTSGTIDYQVLAATQPVYSDGRTAPGTFDAALTIGFSGTGNLTFRTLGTIVMPESGGNVTYTFQTPNYANGQMQEVIHDSLNNYFFGAGVTGNGAGCVGMGCSISLYGDFAGQTPENRLGLSYQTYGGSFSAGRIQGAAIFGKVGTLPGGSGGGSMGGGSTGSGSSVLTSYTGGFNAAAARINFVTTLRLSNGNVLPGSEIGFDALAYTLRSDGGLLSYTRAGNVTRTPGTMTVSDVAGDADVLVGRWSDGTNTGANVFALNANQGFQYMLARALPTDFAAPTSGTVQYDLLAATKPTWVDGSGAPGTFTGSFKIDFTAVARKVGMEAQIVMPTGGPNNGAYTFDIRTAGGLADISQSASTLNLFANGSLSFTAVGDDHSGTCANGGCVLAVNGSFAGSAEKIGVTYVAATPVGSLKNIIGAAAFKAAGTGTNSAATIAAVTLRGATTLTMADGGTSSFSAPEVDVSPDGAITRVMVNASTTQIYGTPGILREHGRAGDAAAWSRWDGASSNANLNPNVHLVTGTPATALPASGKVDYTLTGSTAPTNFQAPDGESGTFTGTLAVQFGAQPRVGFNLNPVIGARGWNIQTDGGSADPSRGLAVGSDMRFASNALSVTGANASSCSVSCSATVVGSLYGTGASHVGLGYQISDVAATAIGTINGGAVFGRVVP